MYLPLALISAVGVYEGINLVVHVFERVVLRHSEVAKQLKKLAIYLRGVLRLAQHDKVVSLLYATVFLYIALLQIKIFYKEVYPANKWTPDDVAISKAAGKYNKPIFLDDDYLPIAIFYSGKNVQPLAYLPDDKKTLEKFIRSDEKNYVVITRNWVVDDLNKKEIKYKLLEKNNSFSILSSP